MSLPLHRVVLVAVLFFSGVLMVPPSRAENNTYLGLDVNTATLDISGVSYTPVTLRGRLGVTILPEMVPAISLESQMGFALNEDSQTINGSPVSVKLATYLGFYVRGDFKVMNSATAYVLLGMATAQLSGPFGSSGNLPNDDTEAGYSYGVGVSYQIPWDMKAYVEYTSIVDGDSFAVSGIGLGVTRRID